MSETVQRQGFFVKPSGEVEMLATDGDTECWWQDSPSLYDDLVLAGYPICADKWGAFYDWIDLSVDPNDLSSVTVYTCGEGPHEHDMGPVSGLFAAWHVRNVHA
jgi:hypothetical protein